MTKPVALVLVSHSHLLAAGVRELVAQMAPNVQILIAGGLPGGGLGTSFDLIKQVMNDAALAGAEEIAVLTDIGSADMTVESVLEEIDNSECYRLIEGPLVEGAVSAAVAAQQGENLDGVTAAVRNVFQMATQLVVDSANITLSDQDAPVSASVTVIDRAGIHARPAAELARMAGTFDAEIQINGADAKSVLQVMMLGISQGDTISLTATGPDEVVAVEQLLAAITAGFDR